MFPVLILPASMNLPKSGSSTWVPIFGSITMRPTRTSKISTLRAKSRKSEVISENSTKSTKSRRSASGPWSKKLFFPMMNLPKKKKSFMNYCSKILAWPPESSRTNRHKVCSRYFQTSSKADGSITSSMLSSS